VFAYNSDAQQDETFKKWFTPPNVEDTALYPSLIGCLDIGIAAFTDDEHDEAGGFSVHPEIGMKSVCKTFPVARKKADISSIEVQSAKDVEVLNVANMPEGKRLLYEGILYPVKKIGKDYMAIDQSRVLLNFLLQLNELLMHKKINPSFSFVGTYMKSIDMFHFTF
jgi:hypothetical protein